ncbi:eukaryotic cytochrome b561-domain-containing protein [Parachaetomium inaequale]|uniref:Eukaryotic cytochrome b561-domain-containing protein n=1 Tax=Parachaetomium inaequale TaxID=2588326 RepID=A0AAN6PD11_9PEZI|nr:eukaryotic cytochrome b561-domain-containing protein [Parachaetomium inaequale]
MASPEAPPPTHHDPPAPTESEPLLGGPGDATQKPDAPIVNNLFLGTAWLSQVGAALLLAIIWSSVFTHPTLRLVSPHPLLQSLGVYTVIQAILILQPTTTPEAKRLGQRVHFSLHIASLTLFITGTTIIELNKHTAHLPHLHSTHAYLGVITLSLLLVQYLFGFTIWAVPRVWGGEDAAKAMWKYHRWVGYTALVLLLATVAAAAETDYSKGVLKVRLWAVLVAEGLIVAGVVPRVHLRKLGVQRAS